MFIHKAINFNPFRINSFIFWSVFKKNRKGTMYNGLMFFVSSLSQYHFGKKRVVKFTYECVPPTKLILGGGKIMYTGISKNFRMK